MPSLLGISARCEIYRRVEQEEDYEFAENPKVYAYIQHAVFSGYDLLFFTVPDCYGGNAARH